MTKSGQSMSSPTWEIREGDALKALEAMPDESVDAVVTDPPYGLGFMGKDWDSPGGVGDMPMRRNHATNTVNTGVTRQGGRQRSCAGFVKRQARDARAYREWCEAWAHEAWRVLKPGGHMLAFGGTRTYHRLTSGIEDAGFEIRDCIVWLYGSGFPKSLNLDGDWGGWGTALKPGHEPIVVARKSPAGTVAQNVLEHGAGALNIDGCRIATEEQWAGDPRPYEGANGFGPGDEDGWDGNWTKRSESHSAGRWPANVVLDEDAAAMLDEQSGELHSQDPVTRQSRSEISGVTEMGTERSIEYADRGGASRFFYCAKAASGERNRGLVGFEKKMPHDNAGHVHADGRAWDVPGSHSTARANHHPTVKPIELMRWLVRLVTPPAGIVLDPFAGSGTTGIAALREDFSFIGIEREPEYVQIARERIRQDAPLINSIAEVAA